MVNMLMTALDEKVTLQSTSVFSLSIYVYLLVGIGTFGRTVNY